MAPCLLQSLARTHLTSTGGQLALEFAASSRRFPSRLRSHPAAVWHLTTMQSAPSDTPLGIALILAVAAAGFSTIHRVPTPAPRAALFPLAGTAAARTRAPEPTGLCIPPPDPDMFREPLRVPLLKPAAPCGEAQLAAGVTVPP